MEWFEIVILGILTGIIGAVIATGIDMLSKPKGWIT